MIFKVVIIPRFRALRNSLAIREAEKEDIRREECVETFIPIYIYISSVHGAGKIKIGFLKVLHLDQRMYINKEFNLRRIILLVKRKTV